MTAGPRCGLFLIEVHDGRGFRPATTAEVDSALRQRELFGAADYPASDVGHTPPPNGLDEGGDEEDSR